VRPITQARFRALNQSAEQAVEQADILRAEMTSCLSLAADMLGLKAGLETPSDLIAHLQSLESSRQDALAAQSAAVEVASRTAARNNALAANLEQATRTIEHLRRVEAAYVKAAELAAETSAEVTRLQGWNRDIQAMNQQILLTNQTLRDANAAASEALQTARRGVQVMMNEWQRMLFEVTGNTAASEGATTLALADQPVDETLATLINLSEASHGARPFQLAVPILAPTRPFPLPWRADLPALRIVDVGSQELDSESDMHAPLRAVAPVETIGFDPFAASAGADAGTARTSVEVTRNDGRRIRTFPALLADGGTVTLHVNRYDPTSSILPSNHALTRQFGLLDLAVETTETRMLPSHRMDDVLPVEGEAARIDLLKIDVQGAAHILLENAPKVLRNTLVCHVEIEFAPVYLGERLFGDIDTLLRAAGFCFVDFFNLGRQRYGSFDASPARAFHRGRTLWGDCIYIRDLDTEGALSADDLYRAAVIAHSCYNKQDLAAELLGRLDAMSGTGLLKDYIDGTAA
jgi:Methyltransferase FkbM domain